MKPYILKPLPSSPHSHTDETFLEGLNDAQRHVVMHGKGPLLVIAGAGSGKTRTLVHRVAWLISQGTAPESILLLTFTRKAAQEMLHRAEALIDQRCHQVAGGTFHAFAHLVLRQYASLLGFMNGFTILDHSDAEDVVGMIRKELGYHSAQLRFPKKNTCLAIISKSINTGRAISDVLEKDYSQFHFFSDEMQKIADAYVVKKKAMQVVDYDDLLGLLRTLLQNHDEVRRELQNRFEYILVDEYQDTNSLQADIIALLADEKKNVMVVGDDAQSIYSFRGANFQNIMSFPQIFGGAEIIKLEENYRSTQPILDLTNEVIATAKEQYDKHLFTQTKTGSKPVYVEAEGEHEQSQFVCQKILELREEGVDLNEIAVLFRSGWHSNDLEVQLKASNIPFAKYGGFKFMEAAHVKDMLALLRLMANARDGISWQRVLLLIEGVGEKTAQGIAQAFMSRNLTAYAKKPFAADLAALMKLLDIPEEVHSKPAMLVEKAIAFYTPYFQKKYDDFPKRRADLESLSAIAERFTSLETFLSEMSLDPPTTFQSDTEAESTDSERITLSTIHSAKGLEWHTVFLISALDGYLPSFQSIQDDAQLEEERRLLYVALTRAKRNLFIIKPHIEMGRPQYMGGQWGGMAFSRVSRFLGDKQMLDRLTDKWCLVKETAEPRPPRYRL